METNSTVVFSPALETASGKIDYKLTNDIVFHGVMQRSEYTLKMLVCALLGLKADEVKSIQLMNPIDHRLILGKVIILDVKVKLNDNRLINVELQMNIAKGSKWWINRSLLYLCRCFDNLERGDNYDEILPSVQISIVRNDIFEDEDPSFYAEYLLKNVKSGRPYTMDFSLRVLYLNHLDKATKQDAENGLLYWARAFLAESWDELKKLAEERTDFQEVLNNMYEINADEQERYIAEAHDKYLSTIASFRAEGLAKGLEEGRKKGLEEGRKKGLEEGRKKGLKEGRKEGLAEGFAKGRAESAEIIARLKKRVAELEGQNAQ